MFDLILDSLSDSGKEVFFALKGFRDWGLLGGGTAISLQIGHRRSYDFDVFAREPLKPSLWRKIREVLGSGCLKTLDTSDQLNLITPNNIAVTFFYDDYLPLFSPVETASLPLLDLRDLAANKTLTIGRRGKWRDYVDVYFLLQEKKVTLNEVNQISQKKFGGEFSTRLFLQQLSFFEDIIDYGIDFLRGEITPEEIKRYLLDQVKKFETSQLKT